MKISRRGATANHGVDQIEFTQPAFVWSKEESCLAIIASDVHDFCTKSRHDYTVRVTQDEMNRMVKAIAAAAVADPASFEAIFAGSLKALGQLQAVVAGIKT